MISLPDGSRLRAAVPPDARWVAMLHAAMLRLGLPLGDCILAGGRLEMALGGKEAGPLLISIEPGGDGRRRFRSIGGGRFALSYGGRRELDEEGERWVKVVEGIFGKLGDAIPPELSGYAAIAVDERPVHEMLARMFAFLTVERSEGPAGEEAEVLVRTTSRCDQACPFCSAPGMEEPATPLVLAAIREAAELLPGATFSLTGGEPALKEGFLDEARAALNEPGIGHVQVQTNAAAFARRLDPGALPPTERLSFFVSLHAVEEGVFDACTGTTGRLADTLGGIERILSAGHSVTLNTVICEANIGHLEELAERLPLGSGPGRASWHLSALICPESNPGASKLLVPYSRLVPEVMRATRVSEGRGVRTSSLLSSTHAAAPPCVLPGRAEEGDRRWLVGEARGGAPTAGEEAASGLGGSPRDRMKAETCVGCAEHERCPGVPRAYGLRFGLSELRPLPLRGREGGE